MAVFGFCCGGPLFRNSDLCPLWSPALRGSDSGGGAGEPSPASPRAARRIFLLFFAFRVATSGQAVWAGRAGRLVEQSPRQRPLRLPQQESPEQLERQWRFSGSVAAVPCSSPLFLVAPPGATVRRYSRAARIPEMPADPRQRACRPRRRKKNSARHVWSARGPQGRAPWGRARAGQIAKPGHGLAKRPHLF
jgi:hypothetical protein